MSYPFTGFQDSVLCQCFPESRLFGLCSLFFYFVVGLTSGCSTSAPCLLSLIIISYFSALFFQGKSLRLDVIAHYLVLCLSPGYYSAYIYSKFLCFFHG